MAPFGRVSCRVLLSCIVLMGVILCSIVLYTCFRRVNGLLRFRHHRTLQNRSLSATGSSSVFTRYHVLIDTTAPHTYPWMQFRGYGKRERKNVACCPLCVLSVTTPLSEVWCGTTNKFSVLSRIRYGVRKPSLGKSRRKNTQHNIHYTTRVATNTQQEHYWCVKRFHRTHMIPKTKT